MEDVLNSYFPNLNPVLKIFIISQRFAGLGANSVIQQYFSFINDFGHHPLNSAVDYSTSEKIQRRLVQI